jgi:hypothetical protein
MVRYLRGVVDISEVVAVARVLAFQVSGETWESLLVAFKLELLVASHQVNEYFFKVRIWRDVRNLPLLILCREQSDRVFSVNRLTWSGLMTLQMLLIVPLVLL